MTIKIVSTSYTCEIYRNLKYGIIGDKEYIDEDLNILNFERIKWGSVRHGDLLYTLFDLRMFNAEEITEPTIEDIDLFKKILKVVKTSGENDYPSTLGKRLSGITKSTKDERQTLMEIMACIEILKPGLYDSPSRDKNDWVYVEYQRGIDKYNKERVNEYFGKYI